MVVKFYNKGRTKTVTIETNKIVPVFDTKSKEWCLFLVGSTVPNLIPFTDLLSIRNNKK